MRRLLLLALAAAPFVAQAQTPDVFVRLDVNLHYRTTNPGDNTLRWYDSLGKHSTAGIAFTLEPGFRAFISQRIQRIPNSGDQEQLDEYYIEDPGLWRVGKQYLPFGRNQILNESARAARGDSSLIFENLPVSIAIADNGDERTRGVSGRIGSRVGVSFAVGENFGIQGTSLTLVRRPEDAPGIGRGYQLAFGVDAGKKIGLYDIAFEGVAFRNGHTPMDPDKEVTDLSVTLKPDKYKSLTLGWSRDWRENASFYRAMAKIMVIENVFVEPILRMRNGEFFDAGVSLRVRM